MISSKINYSYINTASVWDTITSKKKYWNQVIVIWVSYSPEKYIYLYMVIKENNDAITIYNPYGIITNGLPYTT